MRAPPERLAMATDFLSIYSDDHFMQQAYTQALLDAIPGGSLLLPPAVA